MKVLTVMIILILTVAVIAEESSLYCYAPYGKQPLAEFEAGTALVVVHWIDGERGGEARSEFLYDASTDVSLCEIWVIRPEQILGDPDMDALGHETLHCLIGDFHGAID